MIVKTTSIGYSVGMIEADRDFKLIYAVFEMKINLSILIKKLLQTEI